MASKKNAKRITLVSALITLISFLYKLGISYLTKSQVLLIASLSTLMIFICKLMFVKNVTKTREKKKKAYLIMILSLLIYSAIFIGVIILKLNGIDLSNNKTYEGLIGGIIIGIMFLMFMLSIIGLKSSLEKTDLMTIGLKEMTFASALTDLIIIEEFVSRIILDYRDIKHINEINSVFSLAICVLLVLLCLKMIFRYIRYED